MIETTDLVFEYGDVRVLDRVSLRIGDGEFVVLAGANGSGKTTLVRQFNGLLTPDQGEVTVDGTPVEDDLLGARQHVGMVFQSPRDQFVATTVGTDVAFGPENLGLDRDEIDRRVSEALDAVGMTGRGDERIDQLSGGEQERVAIAGALAMEPDHLVLDEPFTGLDEPARQSVLEKLAALGESGTGIVVVTHDLRDVLDLADRVIALVDGRVAVDTTPDSVEAALDGIGVRIPAGSNRR
ncbi:energy-coupling factor ABC transporter ATP-binding protein [Natranaeroarchaeum sulfidigenes]|uniref:Energy-coupling factor transporter ATP-binding protein EcfA2 n=1 Tax=Natranaeroarchaeum sulfidigenes TaxID=2784880 RepID=A0A897MWK4_9EURY|nr:ABC transporter ATP-binding protein [Natranaeroarchaeum sulfidigenes]QSG04358.1 Energy-coupling factor transporter ATP-binding protein EcfA2 [Natranaeroarchaeum sulfidigenes]